MHPRIAAWTLIVAAVLLLVGSRPGGVLAREADVPRGFAVLLRVQPGSLAKTAAAAQASGAAIRGELADPTLSFVPLLSESVVVKSADEPRRSALARLAPWYLLEGTDPQALASARLRLLGHPDVISVEPLAEHTTAAIPDDRELASQTYLPDIRIFEAFDLVRSDGAVVVAIVDGGTDWRHPDLIGNVWTNPGEVDGNGVDDDGNGFIDDIHGWNFANDSADPTGLPATPRNAEHGTHVAGIACASTGNGIGIAGTSWNAKFLPINVSASEVVGGRETLTYAYQGVLYAGLAGADIINASWGRTGRWSAFEASIIEAVTAMGSLIVGAAGNLVTPDYFFPAFYPDVLSVTRLDRNGVVDPTANRGTWIDLAAPGSFMYSTFPHGEYRFLSGTSQSAAVVSGVAALLVTAHPDWTPAQLHQTLRWTTANIDAKNQENLRRFGSGILDAPGALQLTPPGLHVTALDLVDGSGDGLREAAEVAEVRLTLRNELSDATNILLRVISTDPDLVVLEGTVLVPRLRRGESIEVQRNLELYVPFLAERGRLSELIVEVVTGGRKLHQGLPVEALPLHRVARAGRIEGSATLTGKIGYASVTRAGDPGGVGLRRIGERSVMLGGALLVGDGPQRVLDAVSAAYPDSPIEDFQPPQFGGVSLPPTPLADTHFVLHYNDAPAQDRMGIEIRQSVLASERAGRDDFLLHVFEVAGATAESRIGLLIDWELQDGLDERNRLHFDHRNALLHVEDELTPQRSPVAGLVVLEWPGTVSWSWLHDIAEEGQTQPALYTAADLGRKLSDAELWRLMTETAPDQGAEPTGVTSVLAAGPFGQQESVRFSVAYLIADDVAGLRDQARRAKAYYGSLRPVLGGVGVRARLLGNAPNPFNPSTEIRFALPGASHVGLELFDLRGRRVRGLLSAEFPGGVHPVIWDGRDDRGAAVASGVYHVRLRSDFGTDMLPVTLLK